MDWHDQSSLLRAADGTIDWAAMRQRLVAHTAMLYHDPGTGPDYARQAVRDILALPSCPYPGLGQEVKMAIEFQEKQLCKTS